MADQKLNLYIGTYTRQTSRGIYLSEFDPVEGTLSAPRLAAEAANPSFVAMHPSGRFLYAVGETEDFHGKPSGSVSAFAVDPATGTLALLNHAASGSSAPCFISVDASGRTVMVANYSGGSVAAFPIRDDGSVGEAAAHVQHEGSGPNPERQTAPHAHSIKPDPTNRFALAADLGLDRVFVYALDAERSTLAVHSAASTPAGAGPRHVAFHPDGQRVYVVNEMGNSVTTFAWDASAGILQPMDTVSTLPEGETGRSHCAEVQVHPSGRFVYASNRGHDSIAVFAVDETSGALTLRSWAPAGGREPRHFTLDPSGRWLLVAHQNSDSIQLFRVDPVSGDLERAAARIEAPTPVCLCFAR